MPHDLLRRGEELFAQGKLDEAARVFHDVLRAHPRNAVALNNLGVIAFQRGRADEAVRFLLRSIEADPRYLEPAVNVAEIMRAAGRLGELAQVLSSLARRNPDSAELAALRDEARRAGESSPAAPAPTPSEQPLRVLHGTYEVANQMYTISRGLQRLGVSARTVCYWPSYLKYTSDHVLDVDSIGDHADAARRTAELADRLIGEYDVFHFHFGTTLTLDFSDLPRIAAAGKKMVMHHWGSEVRTLSRAAADNPYAKVKVTDEDAIARRLELISRKIPDCIISDPGLEPFVADYYRRVHFIPPALDLSDYPFRAGPNSDKPLVVHAPTAPGIKGTEAVRAAVKSLRQETDFDFHLIQNMPHAEAVKKMGEADLVVDQLHLGSYGTVAIEAMALGKAVVSWVSDRVRKKYPADLPVVSANPDTLQDVLRDLLADRDRLVELGRRGREYVEKHHDSESLAPRYLELYRSL